MSEIGAALRGRDAGRDHGNDVVRGVANVLRLAAAPTFAVMALATGLLGGGADVMCSAATASSLGGMVPMYLLMAAFHAGPWLQLLARRRAA